MTVGLALWWGTSAGRVADLVPDLEAVFLIVWAFNCLAMQALCWSWDRSGLAELREAFDRDVGMRAEVTLNSEGFAVATPGFEGRCSWLDGPVVCERWAGHVAVLHGRMSLLIPQKDAPDDVFERIIEWLEDAWSDSNG